MISSTNCLSICFWSRRRRRLTLTRQTGIYRPETSLENGYSVKRTLCFALHWWPTRTRVYRTSKPIPPLLGMAIRRAISQDGLGGFMKKFLVVSALVLSSSCLASAQSTEPQNRDNNATRYDEQHRNWSWLGLLGLAGLGGLARRKSEIAQRFESR